ncbi:3-phenylpropionate/cinnamic acid dioxygenase subunit beta [Sphingomonas populi]|uniref:3-phenylpropionate/cinnamic acid dioxygenase subunit beta n=1 Tax=Sphingomonas populi TaxID=2484750 RepID=A0A4Q6Y185_9SPHN|nr:3-phenylpropionate/cinnamic acid dioxygenase subunit beta [Sphingomonas populi]RZF63454.1 3-phenylpropionate/cinnamic acid dioxygenase subunit beta [Sphingomonas populi]
MDDVKTKIVEDFIPLNDPTYSRVVLFLYLEARALDRRDFITWKSMLAEDIRYRMPIRVTKHKQYDGIDHGMLHFDDDYRSLSSRLGRLELKSAWAEDPPSRTRRMVTNILVSRTDTENEFDVFSYLHLLRSRGDEPDMSHLSCERSDRIRFEGDVTKICNREILMDQSVLGMPNLAVFL